VSIHGRVIRAFEFASQQSIKYRRTRRSIQLLRLAEKAEEENKANRKKKNGRGTTQQASGGTKSGKKSCVSKTSWDTRTSERNPKLFHRQRDRKHKRGSRRGSGKHVRKKGGASVHAPENSSIYSVVKAPQKKKGKTQRRTRKMRARGTRDDALR